MKTNSGFRAKGMGTTLISICWFEWVEQDLHQNALVKIALVKD
jgi:hypothetical protein